MLCTIASSNGPALHTGAAQFIIQQTRRTSHSGVVNRRRASAGATLGLIRVVASLLSEPRPDGDAQRPLEDGGAAGQLLALPAPGGVAPSGAAAGTGDTQLASAGPAPVGARSNYHPSVSAAALSGDQLAAAAIGGPQTEAAPLRQPDATQAQALRPADASAPAERTDGAVPSAEGIPAANAPPANLAASSSPQTPGDAEVSTAPAAAPQAQATLAAPDEDRDRRGQEQASGGELAAHQSIGLQAPPGPATAVVAPADAPTAVPLPDAPAQPQTAATAAEAGKQPSQQITAASAPSAEPPPRPQPPPPAQLLLLPDDASAEDVQAEALATFRELYPIFEPFQARGLKSLVAPCSAWGRSGVAEPQRKGSTSRRDAVKDLLYLSEKLQT